MTVHDEHDRAGHDHAAHDQTPHSHSHSSPVGNSCHNRAANQLPADQVADCPVMPGSLVVKVDAEAAGLARDYEGVRYYLCCAACGPMFDADPAKYAHAA